MDLLQYCMQGAYVVLQSQPLTPDVPKGTGDSEGDVNKDHKTIQFL